MKATGIITPLRMAFSLFLLVCIGVIGSCTVPSAPSPTTEATATPAPAAGLANPASVFCIEKGGQLVIEKDAQGNESGTCIFSDGSRCDEWAFYRGECKPGASLAAAAELTEAALRNATYDLPDLGVIELKDGKYEKKYGEGATQVNTAGFLQSAAGDLNGDGAKDAAVVLWWSGGGSGTFVHLAAMLNDKGTPKQAAVIMLGDRTNVEALAVRDGKIVVRVRERLASTAVEKQYTLQGNKLVEAAAGQQLAGTYKAEMPAADAAGRQMVLSLSADRSAALTTTFTGKPGSYVEKGTWSGSGISVTVSLTEADGKAIRDDITFELRGDELVSTQWDKTLYGTAGLQLKLVSGVPTTTQPQPTAQPTAQPVTDAALAKVKYNPKTFQCENEPQRTMTDKQWQMYGTIEGVQPNQPGKPGQPVKVGLRIKFGEASDDYAVTVSVIAPDGSVIATKTAIKADKWAELVYPADFTGAKATVPGIYTIAWQIKGGFVTCYGFEVGAQ